MYSSRVKIEQDKNKVTFKMIRPYDVTRTFPSSFVNIDTNTDDVVDPIGTIGT